MRLHATALLAARITEDTSMVEALIAWCVVILIVGIVVGIVVYIIGMIPMDARFQQLAIMVAVLIGVLIIILKALPLLGVAL
jgi:hypothetical protein